MGDGSDEQHDDDGHWRTGGVIAPRINSSDDSLERRLTGVAKACFASKGNEGAPGYHFVLSQFGLIRLAGLPAALALELTGGETLSCITGILAIEEKLAVVRQQLCNRLEVEIPHAYDLDQAYGKRLLHLKRCVHNARGDIGASLEKCPLLDGVLADKLRAYGAQIERHRALLAALPDLHAHELSAAFDIARGAISAAPISRALQLTSPGTFSSLARIIANPDGISRKKARSTAISIARYALRASLKTSPQSAFGPIARCLWTKVEPLDSGSAGTGIKLSGAPTCQVRLRQSAFQEIAYHLVRRLDLISGDAEITLNPTADDDGTAMRWTTIPPNLNRNVFRGGHAAASSISPVIRAVAARLQSSDSNMTIEALLRGLVELGSTRASAEKIVARLLSTDLVQLVFDDVDQQHPLDLLRNVAALLRFEEGHMVRSLADDIAAGLNEVASENEVRRAAGLSAIGIAHAELRRMAALPAHDANGPPLVHEDCFVSGGSLDCELRAPDGFLPDLAALLRVAPLFRNGRWQRERSLLTRRFIERFGPDGVCKDVSPFLQSLAADGPGSADASSESGLSPTGVMLKTASAALRDHLLEEVAKGLNFAIDPALLRDFSTALPAAVTHGPSHYCVTYQHARSTEGTPIAVLNQVYPGPLKMVSRFAPGDHETRAAMLRYLGIAQPDGDVVALPGTFGFNANNHERIADRELILPPYAPSHQDTIKVQLEGCAMRYDPDLEQVYLEDAEGRRLHMHYFGILLPMLLPPLHRLLDESSETFPPIGISLAAHVPGYGETTIEIPRMTLGNLVVCRRTIIVPSSEFPDAEASEADFFLAVQRWRKKRSDLPRHLFFQLYPKSARAESHPGNSATREGKPFPLDLDSALGIALLQKALIGRAGLIVLAEALPEPGDSCVDWRGKSVTSEHEIEIAIVAAS